MSSPANIQTKHSPFEVIVMVSTDAQAARAVHERVVSFGGILASPSSLPSAGSAAPPSATENSQGTVLRLANGTIFISSCNPYGCRMGSGGGTIAALAEADDVYRQWKKQSLLDNDATEWADTLPTVLICHAGGESGQFSTQIVKGTTWKSLPIRQRDVSQTISATEDPSLPQIDFENGQSSFSPIMTNPFFLLMSSLSIVFGDVPRGSVVVVADSDILLSFNNDCSLTQNKIDFHDIQDNGGVVGLAVPAPIETAKTRRVHQLEPYSTIVQEKRWKIQPTDKLLHGLSPERWTGVIDLNSAQVRSPAINSEQVKCTFYMPDQPSCTMAWVDTGVFAFLPGAAVTLRQSSLSTLKCCTKSGLKEMCEERYGVERSADGTLTLEEFARKTSREICLYVNMLHALSTSSSALAGPYEVHPQGLFHHKLYTCTIPTGSFVHLGRTGFSVSDVRGMCSAHCFNSIVSGFKPENTKRSILLNSVLKSGRFVDSAIGKGSVIENCHLECSRGIMIGEQCLLSCIQGSVMGSLFHVPSGICLQLLPLRQLRNQTESSFTESKDGTHEQSFVCICLGVNDDIGNSPPKTLFGLDLQRQCILQKSDLVEGDIWDAFIPSLKRTLLNAKINPVFSVIDGVPQLDFSFLEWISCLKDWGMNIDGYLTGAAVRGVKQWRATRRLSLSEIGAFADFSADHCGSF